MMKHNCFSVAALAFASAMMFTSCSTESNNAGKTPVKPAVISFEYQTLNADGYWCGDETGTPFDNWGSTAYSCTYQESGIIFPANFTPAWNSWSGYAISNRTATTYKSLIPDQFNSTVGKAHSGQNYCVVFPFGEAITLPKPATVVGFYFTNEAWVVDAILNGDGMTPGKFETTDWLKCVVTGTHVDGTTATLDLWLAKDGTYVSDWQWADLTVLGKVESLSFYFEGTKKNSWGLTTPTYLCIDDMTIQLD